MKKTLIKSDVAGIVAEICFNKSDFVKEGENLIFIESMKMEIPVEAPQAGTVKALNVGEGDAVDEGQIILVLED